MKDAQKKDKASWWYLLFVLQFAGDPVAALLQQDDPTLIGLPFFYWFQLLWVIVSAVFTAVVYWATRG